jgi:hypothetical protein
MLTTEPPPLRISGMPYFVARNTEVRLMSITVCQSPSEVSTTGRMLMGGSAE